MAANELSFCFSEQTLDIAEKKNFKFWILGEMDFLKFRKKFDFSKKKHILIILLRTLILHNGQAETAAEARKIGILYHG